MAEPRHAWLEIDLDRVKHNFEVIRREIGSTIGIIGVVKSDAYGMGISPITKTLDKCGVEMFAVISLGEAQRVSLISKKPVLILGYLSSAEIETAIDEGYKLSLYDRDLAPLIERLAARRGMVAHVHLKLETGLNRLGIELDDAIDLLRDHHHFPHIKFEGIYSHLAKASDVNADSKQLAILQELVIAVQDRIGIIPLHLVSSSALGVFKQGYLDSVRVGLAFYGVDPVLPGLEMAISCKALVMQAKPLKKGEGVSYDYTYTAPIDTNIAIAAIGYGDGLSQVFSNHCEVLIGGNKKKVIGNICMNHLIIDIGDYPAHRGEEVVFIGSQKDQQGNVQTINVDDLATKTPLRHHEIITRLGSALPKIYNGGE